MQIKHKVRKLLIKVTGYFIYKNSDLPIGVDLKLDLEKKFGFKIDTIFDVGANTGQTAIKFAEEFPNSKIYSFEPVKSTYSKLIRNVRNNEKTTCYNIAFGERNENKEIKLHVTTNSQLNSLNYSNYGDSGVKEIIKVKKLDDFVESNGIKSIDLLKIDTEGYELNVLKGAYSFITNRRIKSILCEVALSSKNSRNTQLNDVFQFLDKLDYSFVGLYETNVAFYKEGLAYSNALFIQSR